MATITIGGTSLTLPERDGISVKRQNIGAFRRNYDGSGTFDYTATKVSATLKWKKLTAAEKLVIYNAWIALQTNAGALVLPDASSYTVVPEPESWAEDQWYDNAATPFYDVSFTVQET